MCQMPTFFFKEKSEREKTFYILQDFFLICDAKELKHEAELLSPAHSTNREREQARAE